jgi:adenylate cyclase
MLPGLAAVPAALTAGAFFAWLASVSFARAGTWAPLVVPLVVQLPVALILGLLASYQSIKRQREKIRAVLGYYLPERAIQRLAHETAGAGGAAKELVFGTCLVTDAEQYTALSESLSPEDLGRFMEEYYRTILDAVGRHGGIVSDLAGDSMVAVWAATRAGDLAAREACRAAEDVRAAVERFNAHRERRLPTRIGLDSGQLLLGNIGSAVRGEYRAVGDIVNTAARLQGLNRHLGTRVLMSGSTLAHAHGSHTRFLGDFLLVGKSVPVAVFELHSVEGEASEREEDAGFAEALQDFREGRWRAAATRFAELLRSGSADGPCRFYLDLCARFETSPPADWSGVVRMTQK